MKLAAIALALLVAGCATAQPRVEIQKVNIAVPVKCHPDIGQDPVYPDTAAALQAAPNIFERVKLLLAGRLMRIQRDLEKSAALDKCANGG